MLVNRRSLFAALFVSLAGCAPQPRMPTATELAGDTERRRCGPDVDESVLAPIFSKEAILGWDTAYLAAATCGGGAGGCYKRLAGAVIIIKALKGYSAEWLDRALECHSARRALGKIPPGDIPNDPFWLPGKTLDIDVVSTRGEFAATVRTLQPSDAQEIVNRTKAFVEAGTAR
jgi:hypothetical protein